MLLHDRVEVPEPPVIKEEESVHDRLAELVVTTRATVPAKPFSGLTVTIDVPAVPALTVTLVGLALIEKSWMEYVMVVECVRPLLVPVMVTR